MQKSISVQDAQNKKDANELIIIDVRTPGEYKEAHIPGAYLININGPAFTEKIAELDKDMTYATHCNSGGRGRRAAKYMRENGFRKAFNLDGGINKWKSEGLPIESSK